MTADPAPNPAPAASSAAAPDTRFAWQTCLGAAPRGADHYHHFNPTLLEEFAHPPRLLLDIGCASGQLGQVVKAQHPGCRTIGIEPDAATARLAAQNLDRVLCGRFEDFDLEAEGIAPGSVDTVVAADVLEHMYDPWHAMAGLKRYLSPDAQVILSIPNTRNLALIKALLDDGRWTYEETGALDITHVRFFTLREIEAFLVQTGYRLEHVNFIIDPRFEKFCAQSMNQAETNIRVGRISMERVPQKELAELCTWQFFIRARPAAG
jgi:2-polyprenyl-3-methyl-5-hydroxy-6-metoxy-1,4-benzoquinol methylase